MAGLLAFDSGIGGYGIVGALRRRLPNVPLTMLADTALYPYGELDDAVLVARVETVIGQAIDLLAPDAVVIACNTASTLALGRLRARFDIPFIGCVPPVKWAASLSQTRHIGLLATAATVRRPYLADLAHRFAPDCRLIAHGARGLADLAEAAFRGRPVDEGAIRAELAALFGQNGGERIDTVCIGCTHYSFLLDAFRRHGPDGVAWLDPADAVARRTQAVLAAGAVEASGPAAGAVEASGRAAGAAEACGPAAGEALFTAPPADPQPLAAALRRYGFDGYRLLDIADRTLPAQCSRLTV